MAEAADPNTGAERTRRAIRDALGTFLTGVTVVTTVDEMGQPRGITANSFTSVSLDPPLVLVCVDRAASSYQAFIQANGYAVNILGQDHRDVAQVFATKRPDKFTAIRTFTSNLGNPILHASIAWLDCRTTDVHTIGDHAVLIGHVRDFGGEGGQPLGFHQGRFVSFSPAAPEYSLSGGPMSGLARLSWVIEDDEGRVALLPVAEGKLALPSASMPVADLHDEGLQQAAERCLGRPVTIDLLYSFYTDRRDGRLTLTYRGRTAGDGDASAADMSSRAFHPLTESLLARIADQVEGSVLRRYRVERDAQRFGIYSGTDESGSVATIQHVRPDSTPMHDRSDASVNPSTQEAT